MGSFLLPRSCVPLPLAHNKRTFSQETLLAHMSGFPRAALREKTKAGGEGGKSDALCLTGAVPDADPYQ